MTIYGIDQLDDYEELFKGKRLGLITSISGVDSNLDSSIDVFYKKFNLKALFSPEHGVRGNMEAGESMETSVDPYTGITNYSIYGEKSKRLSKEMLDAVDTIVYDIQDVGLRFYTFISTLYYAMQECNKYKKELIVLDRPGMLGGKVEGCTLSEGYESFVGALHIPVRYGLTVGELGNMIYKEENFDFPFKVIPVKNWKRSQMFCDTGNIFVPPSLAIPNFNTAFIYGGTCIFEGTNLSEGRGTYSPFEVIGAPYINAMELLEAMKTLKLQGVKFSPAFFTPSMSKHENTACEGIRIHVTDYEKCSPLEVGLNLLYTVRAMYPEDFKFREPYKEGGRRMIELLFGNSLLLDENNSLERVLEICENDSRKFAEKAKEYYIYE